MPAPQPTKPPKRDSSLGRWSKTFAFWILILLVPVALLQLLGQRNDLEPVGTLKLRADDELERQLVGSRIRSHDSGDGALIGQRETRIAELGCGGHELLRMRSSAQERKVAETVQLGIDAVSRLHDCPPASAE